MLKPRPYLVRLVAPAAAATALALSACTPTTAPTPPTTTTTKPVTTTTTKPVTTTTRPTTTTTKPVNTTTTRPTTSTTKPTTTTVKPTTTTAPAPTGSGPTAFGPRTVVGLTSSESSLPACQASGTTFSTSSNGQVIQNCKITQNWVQISHANVTFRNVLFVKGSMVGDATLMWSNQTFDTTATAGVRFENVEFRDALPVVGSADPARPAVIKSSLLRGTSDGYGDTLKAGSNTLVEDSILRYDYPKVSYAHGDGIQSDYGDVDNITVRHTKIYSHGQNNGCLLENEATVSPANSPAPSNWLFENNDFDCDGGYSVRLSNVSSASRNIVVRNNLIHRTWIYGPLTAPEGAVFTWTGNVDQNGRVVNP